MSLYIQFLCIFFALIISSAKGKTLVYDFKVGYICGAPDGVRVCHILGVNGKFPGPTIEANVGDRLEVTVHNHIEDKEGFQKTSIHWYGIEQRGTPGEDGAPMVSGCPIPYNQSYTYKFKLNKAGTFWWRSSVGWQTSEGLLGPLIVHNQPEAYRSDYDRELRITLADWFHNTGRTTAEWWQAGLHRGHPIPYSVLVNGKGTYPCSLTQLPCHQLQASRPFFRIRRGLRYRIRVINASAASIFYFSIPGKQLSIIEADGVDTMRVEMDRVAIAEGQRYSFIVEMNGNGPGEWIVLQLSMKIFTTPELNINPHPETYRQFKVKLEYTESKGTKCAGLNETELKADDYPPITRKDLDWMDQNRIRPLDGVLAPNYYDVEFKVKLHNKLGNPPLTINDISYSSGPVPALKLFLENRDIPASAIPFYTPYRKVVQIRLIDNVHPFHLHGHTFWIVGIGPNLDISKEPYDPKRDKLILNGQRRDTVFGSNAGWIILRFIADNPGAWAFDCSNQWHNVAGVISTIFVGAEESRRKLKFSKKARELCQWSS